MSSQYLWKAAGTFFYPGDPAARDWVKAQAAKILDGKARDVRAGIRRRATSYGYSPKEREGADACATYLENKKDYLDYPAFLAAGWPVASGLIEGAARWLIFSELKQSSVSAVLGPFPGCVEDGCDQPGDVAVVEAGDGVAQVDGGAVGEAG